MIEIILPAVISAFAGSIAGAVVGAVVAKIKSVPQKHAEEREQEQAARNGVQCLLRAEIIRQHDKYTERGYCPIYAKEALKREYEAYHALGGNDVATKLYGDIMALPEEKEQD